MRTGGVDDQVEGRAGAALGVDQPRLAVGRALQARDLLAGLERQSLALGGVVQHAEQGGAVHGQAPRAGAQGVVMDVQHHAAVARPATAQARDRPPVRAHLLAQTQVV